MTEKERQDAKIATLYEIRLIFSNGEKKNYTTEEIVVLLDTFTITKVKTHKNAPNNSGAFL